MSRIASDAVALANDRHVHFQFAQYRPAFVPHRVTGLSARLMAASNALYNRIDYRDGGTFAEVGQTRHAGWRPVRK